MTMAEDKDAIKAVLHYARAFTPESTVDLRAGRQHGTITTATRPTVRPSPSACISVVVNTWEVADGI